MTKIALGLKGCASAGFSCDSIRGLFGYRNGESPSSGELHECDITTIKFESKLLRICKEKRFFDGEHNPIVTVGSDWPDGLACKTAVNLGNPNRESKWLRNTAIIVVSTVVCTGVTSWSLMVVEAEWNWVRIMACPVLHICLMGFLALPLFTERQSGRPYQWFDGKKWDVLTRRISQKCLQPTDITTPSEQGWAYIWRRWRKTEDFHGLRFLQVRLRGGDVLHFRGDTSFLSWYSLKVLVFLVTSASIAAYLCQYAILKGASNRQAVIWISI